MVRKGRYVEDDWTLFDGPTFNDFSLCLCGRDPTSDEVLVESAKVSALSARFGLILTGCLCDAAQAYDEIYAALSPDEARSFELLRLEIFEAIKTQVQRLNDGESDRTTSVRLN